MSKKIELIQESDFLNTGRKKLNDAILSFNEAVFNGQVNVEGISGTAETLEELQERYPNGDAGVYVVTGNGHWYYWKNGTWNDGGVYQADGISDKSIESIKLSGDVNMINYPFTSSAIVPNQLKGVKDIKMYGFDKNKKYSLAVLRKAATEDNIYMFQFYENDGDTGFKESVAFFRVLNYQPKTSLETIKILGSNEKSYINITVNWDEIPDGTVITGLPYNKTGIMDNCHVDLIDSVSIDDSVAMKDYPFQSTSGAYLNLAHSAILDAKFYGGDVNKYYTVGSLMKSWGTTNRWRIMIHEWDLENDEWAGGSSAYSDRSIWQIDSYHPSSDIEVINTQKSRDIGFSAEITIDWSKIKEGSNLQFTNDSNTNFGFFHPSIMNQSKLEISKNTKEYRKNTQDFLDNAYYSGRWFKKTIDDKEVMCTAFYGQYATCMFVGTSISAEFLVNTYGYKIYYQIDNGDTMSLDIQESGSYLLKDSLANTEHFLTIQSAVSYGTTADNSPFFSGKGMCQIIGFDKKTYPYFGRKKSILFLGDSITVGEGDDTRKGFAGVCCDELQVNCIKIAQPGGALVRNDQRPHLPNMQQFAYNLNISEYALPEIADLVIVNIGTNDSDSVESSTFQTTLINTINRLKNRYLNVPILILRPFNGSRTNETKNATNATNTIYIDTSTWLYSSVDGVHPDTQGALKLGKNLAKELIDKFGISYFA